MTTPESKSYGFKSSIVSYPDRGTDGDRSYRGNTSGGIVRDFIATYHLDKNAILCDPMEGSGTSGDAARAFGIPYRGFDLRTGFDSARRDLLTEIGVPLGSAFLHPAYAGMLTYSGKVWGQSNPADLSQVGSDIDLYDEMLQAVLTNVYRALRPGACYGVLLGSWRIAGAYNHLPSRMMNYAPGTLVAEIIKRQTNVTSAATSYSGRFVRIEHETLLVYRRGDDGSIFAMTAATLDGINRVYSATWRNLVVGFARERDVFTLDDLYAEFDGHAKTGANPHYRAKLRQVVGSESRLRWLARGRYAYDETATPSETALHEARGMAAARNVNPLVAGQEIEAAAPIDRDR